MGAQILNTKFSDMLITSHNISQVKLYSISSYLHQLFKELSVHKISKR